MGGAETEEHFREDLVLDCVVAMDLLIYYRCDVYYSSQEFAASYSII